jgi:hypothetical protein
MMRRGILPAILFASALVAGGVPEGAAEADTNYAAFNADVNALKDRMLTWCEGNRDRLDFGMETGALSEEERFRKACGKTLDGRPVPGRDGLHLFHFRRGNNVDGLEYFGVRQALSFKGESYVLVTAWLIRTTTEVGQKRKISETADAFLMGVHNGAWRTAWRYVDLDKGQWRRPASDDVGAEILSDDLEGFIDRIWKDAVVRGTAKLHAEVESGEDRLIPALQ